MIEYRDGSPECVQQYNSHIELVNMMRIQVRIVLSWKFDWDGNQIHWGKKTSERGTLIIRRRYWRNIGLLRDVEDDDRPFDTVGNISFFPFDFTDSSSIEDLRIFHNPRSQMGRKR